MFNFKVRAVWPELPEPADWTPLLEETRELNWHTNFGPLVRRFEAGLPATYATNDEVAVSASNATSALTACLIAHRTKGPVLCPAFTFQATACAILGAGCQPVILDVELATGTVAVDRLDEALAQTGATAVILVAPYGISTDFRAQAAVCKARGGAACHRQRRGPWRPAPVVRSGPACRRGLLAACDQTLRDRRRRRGLYRTRA